MNEGDLLIDSELVLPASPDLGVGERTRRITTVHAGQRTSTREQTVQPRAPAPAPTPFSPASNTTMTPGTSRTRWSRIRSTIGRGGIAYPVDVRITSSPDVSREHARAAARSADRPLLSDRSQLAGDDAERAARAEGVRRGRWHEARERRRDGAGRRREDRPGGHRVLSTSRSGGDDRAAVGTARCSRSSCWRSSGFYVWTASQG